MDELTFKLSTGFMKKIVSKFISKSIFKKTGHKVDIMLNEIQIWNDEGKIKIHVDIHGEMDSDDFVELLKNISND